MTKWRIKVAEDLADQKRCLRRLVRSAIRSARFLSDPGRIGPFIARTVSPSARIAVAKIDIGEFRENISRFVD